MEFLFVKHSIDTISYEISQMLLELGLALKDSASNIALNAFFTVCTEHPIENAKSYEFNSHCYIISLHLLMQKHCPMRRGRES